MEIPRAHLVIMEICFFYVLFLASSGQGQLVWGVIGRATEMGQGVESIKCIFGGS